MGSLWERSSPLPKRAQYSAEKGIMVRPERFELPTY
jgi:hypothetical protein